MIALDKTANSKVAIVSKRCKESQIKISSKGELSRIASPLRKGGENTENIRKQSFYNHPNNKSNNHKQTQTHVKIIIILQHMDICCSIADKRSLNLKARLSSRSDIKVNSSKRIQKLGRQFFKENSKAAWVDEYVALMIIAIKDLKTLLDFSPLLSFLQIPNSKVSPISKLRRGDDLTPITQASNEATTTPVTQARTQLARFLVAHCSRLRIFGESIMAENIIIDKVIGESGASNSNAIGQSQIVESQVNKGRKKRSRAWDHFSRKTDSDGSEKGVCNYYKREECRKALCRMVIIDELPFRFAEKEGFKQFMKVAKPCFHIPSRTTVTRDCFDLFDEDKYKLMDVFKET
ncbi:hypothetical protein H5410_056074 [Solanum commersonii]|uniref:Uncharacterized protein n=1 Tax=Solanum commersonii TaxID=4109 RepID=A0A9J5WL75_SOLCO|nr:hypothetical protein H5410_056074 [Solanum commersonii]